MPIPRKLASTFSPSLRARGDEYVRHRRVELVEISPSLVRARVQGSDLYDVDVRAIGVDRLDARCNCPYALDHGNCKHIWAVLVACEQAGNLPSVPDDAFLAEGRQVRAAEDEVLRVRRAREAEARARELLPPPPPAPEPSAEPLRPPAPREDARPWVRQLRALGSVMAQGEAQRRERGAFPSGKRIIYVVDVPHTAARGDGVIVELGIESLQRTGQWGPMRQFRISRPQWLAAPEPVDREIAQMLIGTQSEYGYFAPGSSTKRFVVTRDAFDITLRRMCDTGRCRLRLTPRGDLSPLAWDDGAPWSLHLAVLPDDGRSLGGEPLAYRVDGFLERDGDRLALDEAALLVSDGLVIARGRAARWIDHGAFSLMTALRGDALTSIPRDEAMTLLAELYALPRLPPVELPAELERATRDAMPAPRLSLRDVPATPWSAPKIDGALAFDYDGVTVSAGTASAGLMRDDGHHVVRRHRPSEDHFARRLERAGFRWEYDYARGQHALRLPAGRVADVTAELAGEGWRVDFDGKAIRAAGPMSVEVHSGIDWFDLDASVDFGGVTARLPELLAALRRGERTIRLRDDSLGLVDAEWLERSGLLAAAGTMVDGRLRFSTRQLGVLDVLLSALPPADTDAAFERARKELTGFDGIRAADAPPAFRGTLREYQREGLGWLHFLRRFGFGGCLADDMGLGKTVQVLALLESRRAEGAGTSLVVVPRSLVFNWEQEAARFTPELKVLVHRGPERARDTSRFAEYDMVLTTYGTLRRDVTMFREMEFDYAVLDEAQAIKNSATASAKAARLIRARHRVAMSGTPVENRLQELWSLLEFLNPGMLGKATVFSTLIKRLNGTGDDGANGANGANGASQEDSRRLLARAVRPYILRRTKAQVAPELPERLEQTLMVDLSPRERQMYDELRDHYRNSLLGRIGDDGLGRERMHVLEALLRLRQAACHPGLVDASKRGESSSKVDLLFSRVSEAIAEEHKVLVFSQFTSLLALVRARFDEAGIVYEYLDGETKDRQRPVERFQTDDACRVFLVSLKAGGVGLNLTAAEYVYLLDPWWNPAVESQAIDRAHRIGQTRRVFASRLIARDTVEEKVLALQDRKRDLADAIIRADESVVASLGREEVEFLLS